MNVYMALSLFSLMILLYWVITELFAILFRFTGLPDEKARFQVISLLTGCGFTTKESEMILSSRPRRRLARVTMLFGYVFNITIVSAFINVFLSLKVGQLQNFFFGILIRQKIEAKKTPADPLPASESGNAGFPPVSVGRDTEPSSGQPGTEEGETDRTVTDPAVPETAEATDTAKTPETEPQPVTEPPVTEPPAPPVVPEEPQEPPAPQTPKTGEGYGWVLWWALMAASLIGMVTAARMRKKHR